MTAVISKPAKSHFTMRVKFLKANRNIDSHVRWFKLLAGDEFYEQVKKTTQTKSSIDEYIRVARQVIQEEIYNKWPDPGTRTDNLLKSFKAVANNDTAGVTVFSDPSVAGATGEGADPSWSYAAFFEKPEFRSFIPPSWDSGGDQTHPRKHRPFFNPLTEAIRVVSEQETMNGMERTINKWKPKK